MDRIFLDVETGKIVISAPDGLLRESAVWRQIGTIDVDQILAARKPLDRKTFAGRIEIS